MKKILYFIGDLLLPVLVYYLLLYIISYLMAVILVTISPLDYIKASLNYNFTEFVGALLTTPVMFFIYCNDRNGRLGMRQYVSTHKPYILPKHLANSVLAALCVTAFGFAMNIILPLTPLIGLSKAFSTAQSALYSGGIGWELASSGFIVPILEELVFRGIVLNRMRKYMNGIWAIILTAFLFGIVHMNLVQFVYAFILGLVLGFLTVKTGHVYPAIVGHMAVNIFSLLRTQFEWFPELAKNNVSSWMVGLGSLLIGLSLLVIYLRKEDA